MEKDNRILLKLKIPRMFRTSFGSCKSKDDVSDVTERPVMNGSSGHQYQLIELFSPIPRSCLSICKPSETVHNSCVSVKDLLSARTKVSDRGFSLLASTDMAMEGRKCPPASPISPVNSFFEFQHFESRILREKNGTTRAKKKKRTARPKSKRLDSLKFNYKGLFSSDEEGDDDDRATLFSSKSFSTDSSKSFGRNRARFGRKDGKNERIRRVGGSFRRESDDKELMPRVEGNDKMKDSFAVVKRSSDPYSDFRTSMVEMIIERQIFGAKDLEKLLQCFLSLNSYHHHRVIIEVFTEIWEALFSNGP